MQKPEVVKIGTRLTKWHTAWFEAPSLGIRLWSRGTDAGLDDGPKSAMAFSGWHARVFASMECRRGLFAPAGDSSLE